MQVQKEDFEIRTMVREMDGCPMCMYYLHSSELHNGTDALRNHVEVLSSFRRKQRKI